MSSNFIKEPTMLFSLNDVVGVSDLALVMACYLGSVCDIGACGKVSKMYTYIFFQREYDGKSLVNKVISQNFLSRLEMFFPERFSKVNGGQDNVALYFCQFLSRYEYCFSGSAVLATMTGIGVGDETWEWRNPLRKIDIYIRENPSNFKDSLEVWLESMNEYLEMDIRSFQFSPHFSEHGYLIQFSITCLKSEGNGTLHSVNEICINLSFSIF